MKDLLEGEERKVQKSRTFQEQMDGYYEELINFYNKIYRACEIGDIYTGLFAATEITQEIESAFAGTGTSPTVLPDLIGAFDPDNLEGFLDVVMEHQSQLFNLLNERNVPILVFDDFIELKEHIDSL